MLPILAGILLLGVCVFFHELGHFLIGKLVGVKPRVFSIGYGRALFFRRRKSTIYQVTAIPLGGYVQFYGDDPSNQNRKMRKGDFFSVGPWRRMALAFGGPLFSILLGFVIVFILLQTGYRPMDNVVRVDAKSAPYKAGLRDGDRIVAVDGNPTPSFDRIIYEVGFAKGDSVDVAFEREGAPRTVTVPVARQKPGMPGMLPGIKALSRLTMRKNGPKESGLLKGDEILTANGQKLYSVSDLIQELNRNPSDTAVLEINRPNGNGGFTSLTQTVPLKKIPKVVFRKITDVQTERTVGDIEIEDLPADAPGEEDKDAEVHRKEIQKRMQSIFINGESFGTFREFYAALEKADPKTLQLRIGPVEVKADLNLTFVRKIGIRPDEKHIGSIAKMSLFERVALSVDETFYVAKSTFVGLARIIQGRISFSESVSGPPKMVMFAAKAIEHGWETFFLLMAQITIILGVMNLLPIPVLDGGHIVFYLIEAVYKPVSFKAQATATRIGMAVMLALGVYVIGKDLIDIFVNKMFG